MKNCMSHLSDYKSLYSLRSDCKSDRTEVVYTNYIPAGTSTLILSPMFDGEYLLKLYPGGDYYFYGEIIL